MIGVQLEEAIVAELETDTFSEEEYIGWVDGECAWFDTADQKWKI